MPQGFFRRWDEKGHISFAEWTPPKEILQHINVLVISELDVPDPTPWSVTGDAMSTLSSSPMPNGEQPCTRLTNHATILRGRQRDRSNRRRRCLYRGLSDPLCRNRRSLPGSPFANAVASFSVEAPGITGHSLSVES